MGKTCNITIKIGAAYDTVQFISKKTGCVFVEDRAEHRKNKLFGTLDTIRQDVVSDAVVKAAQKAKKKWYKKNNK